MKINDAIKILHYARKYGIVKPVGKNDRAGRWFPSNEENADNYTTGLRSPSRRWPYSYYNGARTLKHIKALATINPEFVIEEAKKAIPQLERYSAEILAEMFWEKITNA